MFNKVNDVVLKAAVNMEINKDEAKAVSKVSAYLQVAGLLGALVVAGPANAADLKTTAQTIFTTLYGLVGVFGAVAIVVTGINWSFGNFLGANDPKKLFFQVILGVGVAFGAVAIITWVKGAVSGGADAITTL